MYKYASSKKTTKTEGGFIVASLVFSYLPL